MLERRDFQFELRAAENAESGELTGYAAVFEELSHPFDDFWGSEWFEEIRTGAFSRAITDKGHDIMALWAHDQSRPIASRSGGSLDLSEDEKGLFFRMRPHTDVTWAADAVAAIRGRLVTKMSIGFRVRGEEWKSKVDGKPVRTLTDIDLYEISPVPLPAYEGTEVEARAAAMDSYKRFLAKDERKLDEAKTKAVAKFSFARARSIARRLK